MKIYTGRGDDGTASLFSGERVVKSHERIEAFGDVDELNSALGALRSALPPDQTALLDEIKQIQSHLIHLSAWLATSPEATSLSLLKEIGDDHIQFLESAIDRIDAQLPKLRGFILPGGNMAAALAHMARTVCRRAERHAVRLSAQVHVGRPPKKLRGVLVYLNRLSDYLFVVARYCNAIQLRPDDIWDPGDHISSGGPIG